MAVDAARGSPSSRRRRRPGPRWPVDVLPGGEGPDEPGIAREVGDDPQLDLVVVGHEQRRPAPGRKPRETAALDRSATGMLCRFGWSDDRRPVRATVWRKVAWIRPSGATSASRLSP